MLSSTTVSEKGWSHEANFVELNGIRLDISNEILDIQIHFKTLLNLIE